MAGLLETLGSMFSGIAGGPDGVHSRIWNELKPWITNLGPAASRKWIPRVTSGSLCEVPIMARGLKKDDCANLGIAVCVCCKRPCCLQHAHIDQYADAICYLCVADAVQVVPPVQRERGRQQQPAGGARQREAPPRDTPPPRQKKPGPSPQAVAAAYATLGLLPGSKWDAVKKAHRKLLAANHPDKAKGARGREAAQARFVEIQNAFDVLKTQYPESS